MTKQIVETFAFTAFFLFGLYVAYWAGDAHGQERGFKRGYNRGKLTAQKLQNESSVNEYVKGQ